MEMVYPGVVKTEAAQLRLLAAGRPARVVRDGASVVVTVPSVLDHEVVAIDLAST
jgi:hypothetical protein